MAFAVSLDVVADDLYQKRLLSICICVSGFLLLDHSAAEQAGCRFKSFLVKQIFRLIRGLGGLAPLSCKPTKS